ncbi:MAG: peptidase S41 [Deltaproteobacteria bacterium RBG_13_53_10]|nr:MAG: peptidase S41 [Deltaproteobacteria bacterium RBG_13_53_10]
MFGWKKEGRYKILLIILLVFIAGVAIGMAQSRKVSAVSNPLYEDLKVFTDVLGLLQKEYVEEKNPKDLIQGAIKGMLDTLDPHSAFMPPGVYKEMQEETKGRFEGLGIEITTRDEILTVVSPIEDTPAFKAGILAGDQILRIDGESTKNMNLMDSVKRLRGPKGTKVTITIMREGFTTPKEITLTRDVIPIRSVRYELMEKQYGYVRVSQFQDKTDSELDKALKSLEEEAKGGLKGMILDLRNNPGGLLDQAVKVSDRFIDSGLIVSMEGRREEQKMKFFARSQGTVAAYPLVVLINSGSASGAEIVAGAIQDHNRGILLGTQTFGKGSVQTIFPLKDGSGLRLTTAKYFTPSGRSIQAKGITPDIVVKPLQANEEKVIPERHPVEKDLERHLIEVEKGVTKEKEKPKNEETKKEELKEKKPVDNQLERGIELLKSWEIFKKVTTEKQG